MSNPFYVGNPVPPNYFIGRDSEIRTAFDTIFKRCHLAIYGESGIGKTSFLRYLGSSQGWQKSGKDTSSWILLYLNCKAFNPFTPAKFWRELLLELKNKVESRENDALNSEINQLLALETYDCRDFRRILRTIRNNKEYLLILLDDYDYALKSHENYTDQDILQFLSEFRNLAVHTDEGLQCLSTVVSTFRRLNDLSPPMAQNSPSPWYNHYLFLLLKPFSKNETNKLFSQNQSDFLNLQSLVSQPNIFIITGGHPTLIQNAGYLLYERSQRGDLSEIEAFAKELQRRTEQVFRNGWHFSTDIERILLMLIVLSRLEGRLRNQQYAIGDLSLIFSQRRRELSDLEERGIIRYSTRRYSFTSSMMEWWVLKEIENSDEEELKQREKILFNLMSQKQIGQFKGVTQQLWQQKEHLKMLFDLVKKLGST